MFVKNGATLVAALSLLASVDAKRGQLHERGSRCNGDNLLNRFRHRSADAVSFCQTYINSITYSVVTVSTDDAHVSSAVTTYSTAYPSPLLTTSYPETRLSSACRCISPPVVTAVVTEYVASSTATGDDATATTDDQSTITDDPSTTSTDDPTTTATDDSTTATDDTTTTTDAPTTTATDDSTTATDDSTTATDDTTTTTTDGPTTTATDDSTTATDDTTTATDDTTTTTDAPTTTATTDASTTTTDPAATATDTPAQAVSLGCFVEGNGGRALKNLVLSDEVNMSIELCASSCTQYAFYGVEYGHECWCDNSIDSTAFVSPDPSVCNFACPGDASETCGGRSTINIYGSPSDEPTTPPTAPSYESVGCFSEPTGARALPQLYASTKMTIELCQLDCSFDGYTYAGLEYGTECWCGNTIPTLEASDACTTPCPGNTDETCGGDNTLQLYSAVVPN